MSRIRGLLVHLLIAGVIGGSLYDIATRQEHWPFSDYPMFALVQQRPVLDNWFRLYGVTFDNREVAILKYSELWPWISRVCRSDCGGCISSRAARSAFARPSTTS